MVSSVGQSDEAGYIRAGVPDRAGTVRSVPGSDSGADGGSRGPSNARVQLPSISLPKGGGAIRGIGEKFATNPVTGTGSMTVPMPVSPGRSGFGPQLTLSYDFGSGNASFGFGWSLSTPAITRKTDKGLPQYIDAEESDVFLLSRAEDLVSVYRQDPDGSWVTGHPEYQRDPDGFWVRDQEGRLVIHEDERDGYRIRRYRPRIEGLFARINDSGQLEYNLIYTPIDGSPSNKDVPRNQRDLLQLSLLRSLAHRKIHFGFPLVLLIEYCVPLRTRQHLGCWWCLKLLNLLQIYLEFAVGVGVQPVDRDESTCLAELG